MPAAQPTGAGAGAAGAAAAPGADASAAAGQAQWGSNPSQYYNYWGGELCEKLRSVLVLIAA